MTTCPTHTSLHHSKLLKVSLKGHFVLSQDGHRGYYLKLSDYINSYLRTQWLSFTVYSLDFSVPKPYQACIKLSTMFSCTARWGDGGPLYLWIFETGPSITLSQWLQGRSQWINTPPPCCHKRFSLYPKLAQNTGGVTIKPTEIHRAVEHWSAKPANFSNQSLQYNMEYDICGVTTCDNILWFRDVKQVWNS